MFHDVSIAIMWIAIVSGVVGIAWVLIHEGIKRMFKFLETTDIEDVWDD